ncbi:MAG: signal recognition particle protein [Armatimonadetes bacterium]|nr:signal recognition particle protein [Armatimonadota bacterium]
MFEALTERLTGIFRRLSSRGKLTAKDIREGLKEIRRALLEADVNYEVVKDFVQRVQQKALGEEILRGLNPAQQIVKIVFDELVHLLGDRPTELQLRGQAPHVVIMCGLQGSGKTTTAGKLAVRLRQEGHKPLLCATDVYRPAAIEQLQQVGAQAGVEVFSLGHSDPVHIARAAHKYARQHGFDVLIVDTAGRLHIDEDMMREAAAIEGQFESPYTLLVVDAMTGQDAVNVAAEFSRRMALDGVILTKLDGDARGGAALSVRSVTGKPIVFVGLGERLDALDTFYPDRMAQRILGMGDVLTLIERAQRALADEEAAKLQQRLLAAEFDLEDFRQHLRNVRKMGPLDQIVKMIPGAANVPGLQMDDLDERELDRVDAIISSMTKQERRHPDILNASRKRRIAAGSGTTVQDVNMVLKQYRQLAEMMQALKKGKSVQIGGLRIGRG